MAVLALYRYRVAPIKDVALTREELQDKQGHLGSYCPVSWATKRQLVNMAGTLGQRLYGCEYEGKMYYTAGPEEQAAFIADPKRYLSVAFPTERRLPVRLRPAEIATSGAKLGMKGFCPVTMLEVSSCCCCSCGGRRL